MEIPQKLRDYINESRAPLPPIADPDEPLQIDSLGLIRLVSFMESDCGIRVEDEELVAENFASLGNLGKLIARKAEGAQTSS
jgi:acyl carrier protein